MARVRSCAPNAHTVARRPAVARDEPKTPNGAESTEPIRKHWVPPTIEDLPKLTDLTLQTGAPIPGTGGSGGSSVF